MPANENQSWSKSLKMKKPSCAKLCQADKAVITTVIEVWNNSKNKKTAKTMMTISLNDSEIEK
jgi:hypothetical protein